MPGENRSGAPWRSLARHTPLGVITDLDGTLLPFVPDPSESRLPDALAADLAALAALPGVTVAIVSGRPRQELERLLAHVPGLWLAAEHGGWRRARDEWEPTIDLPGAEIEPLAARLERLVATVPGAFAERKTWSVTVHYRQVPGHARRELLVALEAAVAAWTAQAPGFERLAGVETLEVRPARMRKSLAVTWLREHLGPAGRLLALGDDRTDEDLFAALGAVDEAVLVGEPRPSRARWRLPDHAAAAALLSWLAATRRGGVAAEPTLPEPLPLSPIGRGRRAEDEGTPPAD